MPEKVRPDQFMTNWQVNYVAPGLRSPVTSCHKLALPAYFMVGLTC